MWRYWLCAGAVLATPVAAAVSSDWIIVTSATNDNGSIGAFLVDDKSISQGDGGTAFDLMLVASDAFADYNTLIDCKGMRWRWTSAKIVRGGQTNYDTGSAWDAIEPGMPINSVAGYVCSSRTKPGPVNKRLGAGDPVAATRAWIVSQGK